MVTVATRDVLVVFETMLMVIASSMHGLGLSVTYCIVYEYVQRTTLVSQ